MSDAPERLTAAIIIATHARADRLRRTLDSLASGRVPPALTDVLVVENGAQSGASAICEEFRSDLPIRYLFERKPSKTRALNRATESTAATLLVFFDDDVRVGEGTVAAYVAAAERHGRRHHFAGPLLIDAEEEPPAWLVPYLPVSVTGWHPGDEEAYVDDARLIGSNWALFRDDLIAAGGFAEHLGPGATSGALGDETELQERLLQAGGRGVYLPEATAWHWVPRQECSFAWARRRKYRDAVTYRLMGWVDDRKGPFKGIGPPRWRKLPELSVKVAIARLLGWSGERRSWLEMTLAETWGDFVGRLLQGIGRGGRSRTGASRVVGAATGSAS